MDDPQKLNLFISLSKALTGENNISTRVGKEYLMRLLSAFGEPLILNLLATFKSISELQKDIDYNIKTKIIGHNDYGNIALEIIKLWYTGQFSDENGQINSGSEANYFNGFIWKVIKAHPPGQSGGPYGYWTEAPEDN